jgi:hypothetical protein
LTVVVATYPPAVVTWTALPSWPVVNLAPPYVVPVEPLPVESAAVYPEDELNCHQAVRFDVTEVALAVPLIDPEAASMVALPGTTPTATPVLPIVTEDVLEELHVTAPVRFWVLPSLYVPVAMNCCVLPVGIEALAGVTEMDVRVGDCAATPSE